MTDNSRLETKLKEIEDEVKQLKNKVSLFTKVSWAFVAIGFIILFIGCGLLAFGKFGGFHEFGDFIGGSVGSIWSLAGLFFVYVAFLGQKQSILNQQIEILYNQEELRATRKELAGQKEQMELQNATLKQQQFENTFFQLFKYHNDLINKFEKEGALAQEAFAKEHFRFTLFYKKNREGQKQEPLKGSLIRYENSRIFKPFLISVYQIILLIDKTEKINKKYYIQLFSSTFSVENRIMIAYYSLHNEYKELKKLVRRYDLINHLNIRDLLYKQDDYNILIENEIIQN